jgi:uroporphyrinogen-III synthase
MNLNGLRVLNTRPRDEAQDLNDRILAVNGIALSCPAFDIAPTHPQWISNLPDLNDVSHAIFISANAVKYSITFLNQEKITWPNAIEVIAIGKSTAQVLAQNAIHVNHMPKIADSEHLVQLKTLQVLQDKTILLFKGEGGRPLISDCLQERGAKLIELAVYQRLLPDFNQKQLNVWWQNDEVDIILFTSFEAMQNIFTLFGEPATTWLKHKPCIVISQRLAQAASQLGMQKIILSSFDTLIDTMYQFTKGLSHGQ